MDAAEMKRPLHRGLHYKRVESYKARWDTYAQARRETALADLWEKENQRRQGTDYGHGVLQDLMFMRAFRNRMCQFGMSLGIDLLAIPMVPRFIIRQRDAVIAATVIQWLGSNVGFDFLCIALRRAGYDIVQRKDALHQSDFHREKDAWRTRAG